MIKDKHLIRLSHENMRSNDSVDINESLKSQSKQAQLLRNDSGHFSMIRALHLADLITEFNGFSGIMSIFYCLQYCTGDPTNLKMLYLSIFSMSLGLFFDFMDGKVARWRKKSSLLGQELDSLADLISFGVAPAVLAFSIGFRSLLDTICLAFFVLCGLTRLARFNVTVQYLPKSASGKSKYFEGFPIPSTLLIDFTMAFWIHNGWILDDLPGGKIGRENWWEMTPVVGLFVLHGCLMMSKTIHIPKI